MKLFTGFTLIELSLILAVGSLLVVGSSIPASSLLKKVAVDTATENITIAIQTAQKNSINSAEGNAWGVCKVSSKIYIFSGNCGELGRRQSFSISSLANVSGISTTTFSKLFGEPSPSSGLSNVVVSSGNYSKTVSLNSTGGLSVIAN